MRVDPTDPDTFEEAAEGPALTQFDVEAPEADAAEQHAELAPRHDETVTGGDFSANEADRAEQARVVELNEDEYR
ncbi:MULTISPECIES: hypothetical protein [Streptomyces]|uniref:DUF5709 domain-containing protein n=1 Tax=Streptomyces yunnanensis TaxID=156453 RepID=A0ABY8A6H0_9ACTN|nr:MULTISPECIES: hypothetical protein [Streptomyces]AJC56122.1 hypothetical protein GZL_03536 [Streptomyces sp. 769]WEB40540.1 hypothetical protein MOV08_15460 [Streptomyces yunnanensis]